MLGGHVCDRGSGLEGGDPEMGFVECFDEGTVGLWKGLCQDDLCFFPGTAELEGIGEGGQGWGDGKAQGFSENLDIESERETPRGQKPVQDQGT